MKWGGGHHTHRGLLRFPPAGSSPPLSRLSATAQEDLKRASGWQVPREKQPQAIRRKLEGGAKWGSGPTHAHTNLPLAEAPGAQARGEELGRSAPLLLLLRLEQLPSTKEPST